MTESVWHRLRGQETVVEMLTRSASRGRLAHGYAFFGQHGVGRRLAAEIVAQCLLCEANNDAVLEACGECSACKQIAARNHPDVVTVAKPSGKREISIDLIAGRPDRRGREGFCYELSMRPMSGDRRVGIIDDAETLNPESANALLKTLEEPPAGSLLVLLATSPDSLLPTILSRVQPIHFALLSDDVIADILIASGNAEAHEAEAILGTSAGSLETARQLLDPDLRAFRERVLTVVPQMHRSAVSVAAALNQAIDDLGGDAAAKRQNADWALRFLAEALCDALRALAKQSSAKPPLLSADQLRCDTETAIERFGLVVERVVTAERAVRQMMPVPLAIEGFCDDAAALLRGADRPILELS